MAQDIPEQKVFHTRVNHNFDAHLTDKKNIITQSSPTEVSL